jgi:ABC-type transport system involved in multi-copper enzyme maturation permease subunit
VSLDRHPILWREWHRRQPSAWGRVLWRLYAVVSALFVVMSLFVNPIIAAGTAGFMVAVGLLMVSVTAATALAEERSHGSLDILLATPLSTREIVLGKWWGAFRVVPWLAVLPTVLVFGAAWSKGWDVSALPVSLLAAALVLAYGAAVTSFGLAAAACQPRLGRAVAVSVCGYLAMTVVYPTIVLMFNGGGPFDFSPLAPSPFFGLYTLLSSIVWRGGAGGRWVMPEVLLWVALIGGFAWGLRWLTLASFDRLSGRVPEVASAHRLRSRAEVEADDGGEDMRRAEPSQAKLDFAQPPVLRAGQELVPDHQSEQHRG